MSYGIRSYKYVLGEVPHWHGMLLLLPGSGVGWCRSGKFLISSSGAGGAKPKPKSFEPGPETKKRLNSTQIPPVQGSIISCYSRILNTLGYSSSGC